MKKRKTILDHVFDVMLILAPFILFLEVPTIVKVLSMFYLIYLPYLVYSAYKFHINHLKKHRNEQIQNAIQKAIYVKQPQLSN